MHNHPQAGSEIKIVFSGPMGAGKTTAIAAVSDIAPVLTEVSNNDRQAYDKASTTVALDYGQVALPDGSVVRLYGTPGQDRFNFMWSILGQGALGIILLLDASQPGPLAQMDAYLEAFKNAVSGGTLVIGVGRSELPNATPIQHFRRELERKGLVLPIFQVDVRRRDDVLLLINVLLCQIETNAICESAP